MLFSLAPFISFNAAEFLDVLEEIKDSHYHHTFLCSSVFKSEWGIMQYYLLIIIEKATEEIADTQISTGVGQDREPVK